MFVLIGIAIMAFLIMLLSVGLYVFWCVIVEDIETETKGGDGV